MDLNALLFRLGVSLPGTLSIVGLLLESSIFLLIDFVLLFQDLDQNSLGFIAHLKVFKFLIGFQDEDIVVQFQQQPLLTIGERLVHRPLQPGIFLVFGDGDFFFLPVLPLVFKYFRGPPLDGFLVPFLLLLPYVGQHAFNVSGMLLVSILDTVFSDLVADLYSLVIVRSEVYSCVLQLSFEHDDSLLSELHPVPLFLTERIPSVWSGVGGPPRWEILAPDPEA